MNNGNKSDYAKLLKALLKTPSRPRKSFHNSKFICHRVMVLQIIVKVVSFAKSQKIS